MNHDAPSQPMCENADAYAEQARIPQAWAVKNTQPAKSLGGFGCDRSTITVTELRARHLELECQMRDAQEKLVLISALIRLFE